MSIHLCYTRSSSRIYACIHGLHIGEFVSSFGLMKTSYTKCVCDEYLDLMKSLLASIINTIYMFGWYDIRISVLLPFI